MNRLSRSRFIVWLVLFTAGWVAFGTASRAVYPVAFGLVAVASLVSRSGSGSREPAEITPKRFLLGAAVGFGVVLLIVASVSFFNHPIRLPSIPEPSLAAQRLLLRTFLLISWVVGVVYNVKRVRVQVPAGAA